MNEELMRLTQERAIEENLDMDQFDFDENGFATDRYSDNHENVWIDNFGTVYKEEVSADGRSMMRQFSYYYNDLFDIDDDEDQPYFFDDEPGIATCNGTPLTKANVIEYLNSIVEVEANKQSLMRVCNELNTEYKAANVIPPEATKPIANSNARNVIIAVVLAVIINSFAISHSIWFIGFPIAVALVIGAIYKYILKPQKEAQAIYNKAVEDREARIRRNQEHALLVKNNYQVTAQLHNSCQNTLNELYGLNILPQRYQNMFACSYIADCLETGRTHTLERTDADPGAYNLYETELRHGQIIDRFDRIEGKLDMLAQNQKAIVGVLDDINSNVKTATAELKQIKYISAMTAMNTFAIKADTSKIRANTDEIRENTAATAFFSQCTARNTSSSFSEEFRARTGLSFNY